MNKNDTPRLYIRPHPSTRRMTTATILLSSTEAEASALRVMSGHILIENGQAAELLIRAGIHDS